MWLNKQVAIKLLFYEYPLLRLVTNSLEGIVKSIIVSQ